MKGFFGDKLLLNTPASERLYEAVKELPIIDYHCHLNEEKIAKNTGFSDIGELWLLGDHYKWRAMRLCGVEEKYITGDVDYKEKFLKYAEILPNLAGNPLYYWTHMELKQIFDIREPLNENNALRIYEGQTKGSKTFQSGRFWKNIKCNISLPRTTLWMIWKTMAGMRIRK